MSQILSYASPQNRRRSGLAFTALGLSILQIPLFFGFCFSIGSFNLPMESAIGAGLAALFIPTAVGIILGLTAITRSAASAGQLRGWWLGLTATLISAAWPIGLIAYVITHTKLCC